MAWGIFMEAGGLKVGGEDGENAAVALEDADDIDADGGDQNGHAHVGGGGPDDACAEDGEHQDDDADNGNADVVVDGEVVVQGGGCTGDGGGRRPSAP